MIHRPSCLPHPNMKDCPAQLQIQKTYPVLQHRGRQFHNLPQECISTLFIIIERCKHSFVGQTERTGSLKILHSRPKSTNLIVLGPKVKSLIFHFMDQTTSHMLFSLWFSFTQNLLPSPRRITLNILHITPHFLHQKAPHPIGFNIPLLHPLFFIVVNL